MSVPADGGCLVFQEIGRDEVFAFDEDSVEVGDSVVEVVVSDVRVVELLSVDEFHLDE